MSNITEERQPGEPLLRPISLGAIRFNYLTWLIIFIVIPIPPCLLLKNSAGGSFPVICKSYAMRSQLSVDILCDSCAEGFLAFLIGM